MNEDSKIQRGDAAGTLGKYRVLARIGKGGMAEVDLAYSHGRAGFNKLVVIKRILPALAEDPEFLSMFLDEASLAARLNHPNVVQTNAAGEEDGQAFMIMEYLDGQALNRILHRIGRAEMPLAMHLRVIADMLGGLHHAHELADYDGTPLGVVHRDISPHNVFVTYEGGVKIVDFGIAKARTALTETHVGMVKGKIAYMAPEQARMERVDRRADIYSAGVMLWEAATGARPWTGKSDGAILRAVITGKLPSPRTASPDISVRLEEIILKATAADRDDRYATAADLQTDLEAFLDERGGHVDAREMGKLIAARFAVDRARIKAIIDRQLLAVEPDAIPARLPILDPATDSSALDAGRLSDSARIEALRAPTPARAPVAMVVSVKRRFAWMAGGAFVLGAALAAGLWAFPTNNSSVATASAATLAPAMIAEPPAPPARVADVALFVSVSPPEATMFLDDHPISGNPFKGRFPRDGASHELRIEAPGFVTRTEIVSLDRDREIERVLTKSPPVPGKMPEATEVRRGGGRAQRSVDSTNPYEGK